MGQLPKSKIEQLKREKRESKAAKKRKVATRDTIRDKIVRFLIFNTKIKVFPEIISNFASFPKVKQF